MRQLGRIYTSNPMSSRSLIECGMSGSRIINNPVRNRSRAPTNAITEASVTTTDAEMIRANQNCSAVLVFGRILGPMCAKAVKGAMNECGSLDTDR